jgi:hypothetical protein
MLTMKRVSAFIICLVLLMANNAFCGDNHEVVENPGQVRHYTDILPQNWTPTNRWMAGVVTCVTLICGVQFLRSFALSQMPKSFCGPYINPQVFNDYNAYYNTNLPPTDIFSNWGADIQNNPILAVLDNAYRTNQDFQFNLSTINSNCSHIVCQYSPVDYRSSSQSCLEYSPNYRDISFELPYDVSRIYQGQELRKWLFSNYMITFYILFCFAYMMG